jgi:hypothetical protein
LLYPGVQRFSGVRDLGGFQFAQHLLIAGYSFRKTGNPLIQGTAAAAI